jgi:hypothetical protein
MPRKKKGNHRKHRAQALIKKGKDQSHVRQMTKIHDIAHFLMKHRIMMIMAEDDMGGITA